MYEANQHDDDITADNIVRSQFGSPSTSGNGVKSSREPRNGSAEPYRFDPARPRRRRYAAGEANGELAGLAADEANTTPPAGLSPADVLAGVTAPWTVKRPNHLKRGDTSGDEIPTRRPTRAERRRAASEETGNGLNGLGGNDEYATTRSADLTRIASFLRSTQDSDTSEETDDDSGRGRHSSELDTSDKTSELPTVPMDPMPATTAPVGNEAVLAAVRRVPGVTGARLTDSDSKLALDIADDADSDVVHRKVIEVLDSHLGVQAQPVSPAVGTVDTDPMRERGMSIPPGGRAVLERIQVISSGFEATVEVGLAVGGVRAVGRSSGPAVDWHVLRGAADATVDAVSVLLGKNARVVVEHAAVEPAGSVPVAVVMVLLLTETGAEQLAGAAPVTGDRRQAVVHATLQALNRRLETMLVA